MHGVCLGAGALGRRSSFGRVPCSHCNVLAMMRRGGLVESFLGVQTSDGRLDGLAELSGALVATGTKLAGLLSMNLCVVRTSRSFGLPLANAQSLRGYAAPRYPTRPTLCYA